MRIGVSCQVKCGRFVWCYMKPNKRGRVSALLVSYQDVLARMLIHDDHTIKTTVRTNRKLQIHSHNIRNSGICIEWKWYSPNSQNLKKSSKANPMVLIRSKRAHVVRFRTAPLVYYFNLVADLQQLIYSFA